MTDEERDSITGLVSASEEIAAIAQQLHEFLKVGKTASSRSWRAMSVSDVDAEVDSVPPMMLKMLPAK